MSQERRYDREASSLDEDGAQENEISLKETITTIWRYRRTIGATVTATTLVFALGAVTLYLRAPVERMATLDFRPVFEGMDKGEYPNGTPFSSGDIISNAVLNDVFQSNELDRFQPFQAFKNAVFVVQSNPDIDLLSFEYRAKLSDTKLSTVDRARIEEEFRKKRESMSSGYSLSYRRSERATRMPHALMGKVLEDTLSTWARQAAERRGVLKFNISVLSRNILPEQSIETEDYIVVVDILRSKILRTLANIDQVSSLPGAAVARSGKDRISLAEVRANLEDVYRFKVQPLIGMIRSTGLSKDPQLAVLYLENQLFQNKLESNEATGRVTTLQTSLRQYMQEGSQLVSPTGPADGRPTGQSPGLGVPALIPQFGESFLDRLTQMANQNSDTSFRQDVTERVISEGIKAVALEKDTAYYEDLIAALKGSLQRGGGVVLPAVSQRAAALVKVRAAEALADLLRALDQVNAIYTDLSAHNLNPTTLLYKTTAPFTVHTTRALSLRTIALAGGLVFFMSLVLACAGSLAHAYIRGELSGAASDSDPKEAILHSERQPNELAPSQPTAQNP